jgi:hypothetical protein
MAQRVYAAKNIVNATAPAGVALINKSCYVTSIVINSSVAGQTLTIQDRGQATPAIPKKKLVGPVALSPSSDGIPAALQLYNDRVLMLGGVDAVTTGAGTVDIWVCATVTDEE